MRLQPCFRAVVVLSVFTAAGCTVSVESAGWIERSDVQVFERTLEARSGGSLRVDVWDADVDVEGVDREGAYVEVVAHARPEDEGWAKEVFERIDFQVSFSDNVVRVEASKPRISQQEYRDRGGVGFTVRIEVPRRFDVDVDTGDGDVTVDRTEGDAHVHTGDGDVRLTHLKAERISADTDDGDIDIRSSEASSGEFETGDGDVRVESIGGPVSITTGDGNIELELARSVEATLHSGDGDITIDIPTGSGLDIDFRGEEVVLSREGSFEGRKTEESARGSLNGGGPRLRATSGDGTVRLRARG